MFMSDHDPRFWVLLCLIAVILLLTALKYLISCLYDSCYPSHPDITISESSRTPGSTDLISDRRRTISKSEGAKNITVTITVPSLASSSIRSDLVLDEQSIEGSKNTNLNNQAIKSICKQASQSVLWKSVKSLGFVASLKASSKSNKKDHTHSLSTPKVTENLKAINETIKDNYQINNDNCTKQIDKHEITKRSA